MMTFSAIRSITALCTRVGVRFVLLSCMLVAGCATVPESSLPVGPVAVAACAGNVELTGRFSVRYLQDGREEALHGSFSWTQQGEITTVSLMSPLGQTMALIEVTPHSATLTEAGKLPRMAEDADALAAAELGWPLPVTGLREWLRGCALDASGRRFVASPKNDSVTTNDGWRIRYVSWHEEAGVKLPRRLDLDRGEVSLKLIIDRPVS